MNVNTQIWGDPSIWFHKQSAPNVSSNCVLSELRVGATTYEDSDFTNYPATKFCRDICLFGYWRDDYLNPDGETPLDNSLSYTAIANPELPQMDIRIATPGTTAGWANNALLQSNPNDIVPFSLATYRDYGQTYNPFYNSVAYGIDGVNNDASIYAAQGFQRWCPFGRYDKGVDIGNTRWGEYNPNGRLGMIGSFGIKSIILELMVVRYDGGYYETATQTLKSYANQSLEWRMTHPIFSCYARPYYRTNKNGTYTTGAPLGYILDNQMIALSPVFYRSLHSNGTNREYTTYLMGGHGQMTGGYFPIYGAVLSNSSYTSQWVSCSHPYDNPTQTQMNSGVYFYGCQRGELIKRTGYTGSFQLKLEGTDENIEWLLRGAAAYGMFFCTEIGTLGNSGRDSGATERWLDNDMYCGIIENDGMTYGNYTRGEDNKDNQIYGWKDSTQTPFDPSNIPDTDNTHYDYETKFNHYGLTACSCNQYVVYESDVVKLADIIATAINTRPDPDQLSTVDYALNNGLTNNPVDTIISVRAYPARSLPITEKLVGGVLTDHEPLHCGAWYNNDVTGYFLGSTFDIITFSFRRGTNNGFVAAFDNSFLDYAPYTRAELIIPYCGTVQLNPADFLNHDINVKIIVDYITGICTAFVMRENVAVMTVSGSMGIDIPITGLQNATYDSQRLNAVFNRENANANNVSASVGLFGASVGLAASVATGNVVGAIASVAGIGASIAKQPTVQNAMEKADYELTHQQLPTKVVQSGTPMISYVYENCCRLIVYRPVISEDFDPAVYADTVGFACLINGTVSQFTGLTVGTIDTAGVNCTEREKEMIQKLFAGGVYL